MITTEAQLYQDYLQAERQYSDLTVKAYLCRHWTFRVYLNELYERQLARTTIARKISSLRMFFQFMLANQFVTDNPFENVALRKHQNHLPEFFMSRN